MRYMLLIYGPDMPEPQPGQEAAMPDMTPWFAYTQWLKDEGLFVAGDPLAPTTSATTVRVRGGRQATVDGPFAETKEVLGGLMLVELADLDEAIRLAAMVPAARGAGAVEIRPVLQ